jgi:hypothetical protein
MGKSKYSCTLSEMLRFLFGKSRAFGVLNRIFQDTETELFETIKIGTVPGKPRRLGSLVQMYERVEAVAARIIDTDNRGM